MPELRSSGRGELDDRPLISTSDFMVTKAFRFMVVYHPDSLHEGIINRTLNKIRFDQRLAAEETQFESTAGRQRCERPVDCTVSCDLRHRTLNLEACIAIIAPKIAGMIDHQYKIKMSIHTSPHAGIGSSNSEWCSIEVRRGRGEKDLRNLKHF